MKITNKNTKQTKNIMTHHTNKFIFLVLCFIISSNYSVFSQSLSVDTVANAMKELFRKTSLANSQALLTSLDKSSGYVGILPHFTLGYSTAQSITGLTPKEASDALNNEYDFNLFNLPGIGNSSSFHAKVGMPILKKFQFPLDLSLFLGYIPGGDDDSASLLNTNDSFIQATTNDLFKIRTTNINFALDVQHPLFYEQRYIPALTVSMAYGFSYNSLSFILPTSGLLQAENGNVALAQDPFSGYTIFLELVDPKAVFTLSNHTLGLKVQGHKNLLFLEPYLGFQPFVSFVKGSFTIDAPELSFGLYDATGKKVENYNANNIEDIPGIGELVSGFKLQDEINGVTNGLGIITDTVSGGIRFFGGFSLRVWKIFLDTGFSYDPITKSISISQGGRLSF